MSRQFEELAPLINDLISKQIPFVMVTLVNFRGSAPQVSGAKALIGHEGLIAGTIGGGKVEAKAISHGQDLLNQADKSSCDLLTWNLQRDVGMTCGGEVQFLFEFFFYSDWNLAVFGAGHIAQALIPLLSTLNCRLTVIDSRAEWLEKLPSSPHLHKIHSEDPKSEVQNLSEDTYIISMTQGHATDLPILSEVLNTREAPYLGVIGSRQKAKVMKRELKEQGFSEEKIGSFFCPVGLPIGNNTPAEIAISIAAQLLQERDRNSTSN